MNQRQIDQLIQRFDTQRAILEEVVAESKRERAEERRLIRDLLHDLRATVRNLEDVPGVVERLERVVRELDMARLLKGREMADRVGLHPDTLRRMAEAGQVPAYQTIEAGDWYYDPAEVTRAIKRRQQVAVEAG